MKYFLKLTLLLTTLLCLRANAATVSSLTQVSGQSLNFGNIAASDSSTGTLKLSAVTTCAATGGVKSFGPCQAGNFLATGQNGNGNGVARDTIAVFLTNPGPNMSNGGSNTPVTYSLSPSSTVTSMQFTNSNSGSNKPLSITIPVYGTLTSIAANQTTGNYSGSFTIYACTCNNTGCPTSAPC